MNERVNSRFPGLLKLLLLVLVVGVVKIGISLDRIERKGTMVALWTEENGWEEVMIYDLEEEDLLYEVLEVDGVEYFTSPPCREEEELTVYAGGGK